VGSIWHSIWPSRACFAGTIPGLQLEQPGRRQRRCLQVGENLTFIDEFIEFLAFPPEVSRVICTRTKSSDFAWQIADRPVFRGAIAAMSNAEPMPALRVVQHVEDAAQADLWRVVPVSPGSGRALRRPSFDLLEGNGEPGSCPQRPGPRGHSAGRVRTAVP
jgi:hypothetical protein